MCKQKKLRLRLASELDRYTNKLNMNETYNLIYKLALIYSSTIKEQGINYGIFYETPHSFWDTILFEVMKSSNCKVIILTRTLFNNLLLDREKFNSNKIECNFCLDEINKIYDHIKNISSLKKYIEIKSFWNNFNQKNILKSQRSTGKVFLKNTYLYSLIESIYNFNKKLIYDLKNLADWRDTSEVFYNQYSLKDRLKSSFKRLKYNCTIFKRRKIYQSFINTSDQYLLEKFKKKFVYYPLPVEPERTTIPEGGEHWYHLLSTITQIRSLLPKNIVLIVKEHPNMFIQRQPLFGYRSPFFYNEIASLSNTYLINHNVSSPSIIKAAKVVVINSGSSGFEAFLNGTSVITLGRPWYKDIKGIRKASTKNELIESLKILLSKKEPKVDDIKNNLIEFINKKTFIYGSTSAGLTKILKNFSNKELKEHSYKSALSLLSYIDNLK